MISGKAAARVFKVASVAAVRPASALPEIWSALVSTT